MKLKRVVVNICDPCLKGEGSECHVPECSMFLHRVDLPFTEGTYEVLSEQDDETGETGETGDPCKPSEPLRRAFSQEELIDAARKWLNENYSVCKKSNPDKFYERLGFMVDFATDAIQADPSSESGFRREIRHVNSNTIYTIPEGG